MWLIGNIKMSNSILLNNLSQIRRYDNELAEKILAHNTPDGQIEVFQSISGDYNITYNGEAVHDDVDPLDEAQNIYYKNTTDDKSLIYVILGLGLGYLLKQFVQNSPNKLIIFEPNLDILRFTLEVVDLSEDLAKQNVSIVHNAQDVPQRFKDFSFNYSDKLKLIYLDFYARNYTKYAQELLFYEQKYNIEQKILNKSMKINVGAGKWEKEGWKTVDCYQEADIQVDLRKCTPFPVADNMIEKVFSSHCIEHIEDPHFEFMLKELYRCMKSGAVIRLACPDADGAFEAYKRKDIKWFDGIISLGHLGERMVNFFVSYERGGPKISQEEVDEKFNTLGKEEFIRWCISLCDRSRPYIAHINGFYYEKLERQLKEAGFVKIERSSFKGSRDEELRGPEFDLHPSVSIFVEAYKP